MKSVEAPLEIHPLLNPALRGVPPLNERVGPLRLTLTLVHAASAALELDEPAVARRAADLANVLQFRHGISAEEVAAACAPAPNPHAELREAARAYILASAAYAQRVDTARQLAFYQAERKLRRLVGLPAGGEG